MLALMLGFIIAFMDQFTKTLIIRNMVPGENLSVIPGFFNLTYLRNTGAVWGILQDKNEWLIILSLLVLVIIIIFYRWLTDNRCIFRIAIGCMLGGITGNLIDRIKFGWVTDFLDFYWLNHHWPAFNLADSSICVGVIIYLVSSIWFSAAASSDHGSTTNNKNKSALQTN